MRRWAGIGLVVLAGLAGCSGGAGKGRSGSSANIPRTTPPLPNGWKEVKTRFEIAVDVPADWPVMPWQSNCGVQTPTVFLGPQGRQTPCSTVAPATMVVIGAYAYVGAQKPVVTHINGMEATEVVVHQTVSQPVAGTVTTIWVRLISGTPTGVPLGLFIYAGESTDFPGGGPGMAAKIVSTIHGTVGSS